MDDCCRFIGRANVHMESRDTLNAAERAAVVAGASAADMICNFPLWIVAKRLSAGVGLPNVSELYKGSGSLYFAMGPMVVVQDGSTALALDKFNQAGVGPQAALCASAMLSGAVGALAVGAQVEGCITRAHATGGDGAGRRAEHVAGRRRRRLGRAARRVHGRRPRDPLCRLPVLPQRLDPRQAQGAA